MTKDERLKAVAAFKRKVLRYLRRMRKVYASTDVVATAVIDNAIKFVLESDERDAKTPGGLKGKRR